MTPDRVKVSLEGYGIWGGMEAAVGPDEDPIEAWLKLYDKMQFAMSQKDSMRGTIKTEVKNDLPVDRIKGIEEAINCCTTLTALERFRPMVERENVPALSAAYHNKKQKLQ